MQPPIQYATTTDGIRIAYWTLGSGGVPLVMSGPLGGWSHTSLECRIPALMQWYERIASNRMLVRYDERGLGLSQRHVEITEEGFAFDAEAVIDALGVDAVDLLTFTGSAPSILRLVARRPEAVHRLVLWSPFLRGSDELDQPRSLAIRTLIERDWELFTETMASNSVGWGQREAHEFARFIRHSIEPDDAARMFAAVSQADATPWLTRVDTPTLIIGRVGSSGSSGPRDIAASMPNARLIELPNTDQVFRDEHATQIIESFLDEDRAPTKQPLPSGTASILFADIADSTALTERMGDAAFRQKARFLDDMLRKRIRSHGGMAIEGKLLGDGVLAVFQSAREAVAAAHACHEAATEAELQLHVGVHAGDVIQEDGNVFGGAVNIAARVCAISAPGETLVSGTVRDLARTSAGVQFEDRGSRDLKGIADPVHIFAVSQSE